ncbi:spore germination protein (amino acid permease) [Ruminiclostridium sufflavum DSM 19573]|uniref:Spore germination protein (Amino acid permease) n=1 Tax=Ruminiclostridium sufflavum DSM 19573 TaxID=1121337 RepID=A0A318XJF5_9FIRM|nr:endospore germination permease [Ruminiclostridium sufflavum]PYG87399.1 spore germination protein (amino acid permease) [Ruminiclostridium sufflavum DSM 19573]
MSSEGQIGLFEAICISSFIITTKIFYTSTSFIVKEVGTASWYTTLLSCAVSLFFFFLIYLLMKRFEGNNIVEIYELVLGKFLGKLISICFCAYGIFYAGSTLREFVEMIKAFNLPYTPPSVIMALFIGVVCLIVYFGLNGISRISVISFFPVIAGFITILVLTYPEYDADYLKPYLGYGINKTLITGVLRSSAYDEFFILTVIINSIHGLKNFKKAGVISLLIAGISFGISVACYLMVFGYKIGSENLSGMFELARVIYYNRFLQRLESIFLFTWVISSVVSVSISFYLPISIYCKAFRINRHKPLIFPFSFLLFLVAILPDNLTEVLQMNLLVIRQYSMFFIYLVPVAVLIISLITRKRGAALNAQKN